MNIDQVISLLALITLIELMIFVGISTSITDFVETARNIRLVAQGFVANYALIPALTIGLLLLFRAPPMVCVGFLILAVCPGGPYGPPFTAIARGNTGAAAGLMVLLAAPSAFLSPALLRGLAPILTGNQSLNIDLAKMVMTLLLGQVAPLLLGLSIKQWAPRLAARLLKPAQLTTKILNLIFIGVILAAQYKLFLQITVKALIGMLLLLVASMVVGWISAVSGAAQRSR